MSNCETAQLTVRTADDASEIFVMNSQLRRISKGVGELSEQFPLGIYKVRVRSGAAQQDQLVELTEDGAIVNFPAVLFRSSVPMEETLTTHEYHQGPAVAISRNPHVLGHGGSLMLFVRDEEKLFEFRIPEFTLSRSNGSRVSGLTVDGEANSAEGWAGLCVEIVPGTYSLTYAGLDDENFEMFITVCEGFQTQVFIPMTGPPETRVPSLEDTAVLMSLSHRGFEPGSAEVRLSALASQALRQGRSVAGERWMNSLLNEKFEHPFLGVMAAHLLLRRPEPNLELVERVLDRLAERIPEHPDVLALGLKMGRHPPKRMESPPTLQASPKTSDNVPC